MAKKYSICRGQTLNELCTFVNIELGNGYELVGGPFSFMHDNPQALPLICQAVLNKEAEDVSPRPK